MGRRQAADHRGSDLPVEGLFRPRAPPSQDPRWAADSPCSKGRSVHLWTADQRCPRPTAASLGRSVGLAHCTSIVSGVRSEALVELSDSFHTCRTANFVLTAF